MSKIKIFALGGLNEIGKNMYVVEVNQDLFVFDAGLKYADDQMLGVDYIIPNYDYLKENKNRIMGIFLTHGHDEQVGALPDMVLDLPDIKIYGTSFTLEIVKKEFSEENLATNNLIEIKAGQKITFGENSIFPVNVTHSVPDAVGYALYTNDGVIFYTGNFIFDPMVRKPYKTDVGKLAYIGKHNVLALLSESTNAENIGYTSPNHRTISMINEILDTCVGNRIIFSIFEAQLYRIQELFTGVSKTNRNVVIIGKNLESIVQKAIDMKYIDFDKSRLLSIYHVNDENVVVIVSDEREKLLSNMNRIVKGYDKFIKLTDKDTVVFASRVYDGMEKSAAYIFDAISKIGSNLVILSSKKYLSQHASSEDLMMMLDLMQPRYYIPIIGEYRHQVKNANLAKSAGMPENNVLLKLNGQVIEFNNGILANNDNHVKVDDILIDGKTVGDIGEIVLKDREMLSENGIVIVTVAVDRATKKILAGPEILTRGFIYVKENIDLIKEAEKIVNEVINENISDNHIDFNKIKLGVRDKLGKYFYQETECKPMILVVVQEV